MNYKGLNAGQMVNCLPWVSCHVQRQRRMPGRSGPTRQPLAHQWWYLHRLLLGKPGENSLVQRGCLGPPGEPLLGTGHAEGHRRDLVAELNTDDTANRASWWDVPTHPCAHRPGPTCGARECGAQGRQPVHPVRHRGTLSRAIYTFRSHRIFSF